MGGSVQDGTVETVNAAGQKVTHTYANGKLISSTNETTQEKVTYTYDDANHVTVSLSDGGSILIDLGPDGGEYGGRVVACGPPGQVRRSRKSYTAEALRGACGMRETA